MREIVILKFTTPPNLIDQSQPSRRTIRHGNRNRTVQLDHRGRIYLQQEVVEPDNLRPIGLRRGARLGVHRSDCCLQRIRPAASAR